MKTLSMIATALLFMGVSTLATGQETTKSTATTSDKTQVTQQTQATTNVQRPYFVDENNNGVCDNYENGNVRMGQKMGGQGLGRCRGAGYGRGQGRMNGQGRGQGRLYSQGRGGNGNCVDANNDGICDYRQDGTAQQRLRDGSGKTTIPETQTK